METVSVNAYRDTATAIILRDIDHHVARQMREELDTAIRKFRPKQLVLDFLQVEFMDSSGIGLIMGRHKLMSELGGSVQIQNLNRRCRRLLELSGITRIIQL